MTMLKKSLSSLPAWLRGGATPLAPADQSRTIDFARICLIVGLVFLHYEGYPNVAQSPFRGINPDVHPVATFINSFVLFFFFAVVPLLSVISGWLFFSFSEDAERNLMQRIRRRFQSLYLPLVFWNLSYLAVLYLLYLTGPERSLLREINIDFATAGAWDYVNAVFAVTGHPIGFQFWFVRDLFVTILASPLLWVLLRQAPYAGLALLGLVWISDQDLGLFFRTDVLFFFYIGGLLRTRQIALQVGRKPALLLLGAYCALVAARALAPYYADESQPLTNLVLDTVTRGGRIIGVLACWGVFLQLASIRGSESVARLGGFAFFLHAIHFPLLAEAKIFLWQFVPAETDGWMLLHYAASVALTVGVGLAVGLGLAALKPNWFALLNGGRVALKKGPATPPRAPLEPQPEPLAQRG
jgi:succinoglycan biosynthesis protein ExoH